MLVYEPHWYSKNLTLAIAMSCEFTSDLPFPHLRSGNFEDTSNGHEVASLAYCGSLNLENPYNFIYKLL